MRLKPRGELAHSSAQDRLALELGAVVVDCSTRSGVGVQAGEVHAASGCAVDEEPCRHAQRAARQRASSRSSPPGRATARRSRTSPASGRPSAGRRPSRARDPAASRCAARSDHHSSSASHLGVVACRGKAQVERPRRAGSPARSARRPSWGSAASRCGVSRKGWASSSSVEPFERRVHAHVAVEVDDGSPRRAAGVRSAPA